MVASRNIFFHRAEAVGYGLATREFPCGFNVDAEKFGLKQSRVNHGADGESIVNCTAARGLAEADLIARDSSGEVRNRPTFFIELACVGWKNGGFLGDVQPNHGDGPAGVEDDRGGLGILVDVVFGGAIDVATGD